MDYLDPSEGWTSLAALPTASQLQAQAAVTAAVQRMHAVVITDPDTGQVLGRAAHGDLRPTNIMLCKAQASDSWSTAKVLFVDFDCEWSCLMCYAMVGSCGCGGAM
jgi:Ser/Thr protein kinase RdoA (MazF antagonist)